MLNIYWRKVTNCRISFEFRCHELDYRQAYSVFILPRVSRLSGIAYVHVLREATCDYALRMLRFFFFFFAVSLKLISSSSEF